MKKIIGFGIAAAFALSIVPQAHAQITNSPSNTTGEATITANINGFASITAMQDSTLDLTPGQSQYVNNADSTTRSGNDDMLMQVRTNDTDGATLTVAGGSDSTAQAAGVGNLLNADISLNAVASGVGANAAGTGENVVLTAAPQRIWSHNAPLLDNSQGTNVDIDATLSNLWKYEGGADSTAGDSSTGVAKVYKKQLFFVIAPN